MSKFNKYISDYFLDSQKILAKFNPKNIVILQFFQRRDFAVIGGMDEVLKFLVDNTDYKKYKIRYLQDGSRVKKREIVLELEGPLHLFGHVEGIIDGILSRSTSIATNAFLCKKAANNKEIIFMADRSDHYLMHQIDGKAAKIGGISIFSNLAQSGKSETKNFGSMPHSLIQNFDGDLIKASQAYRKIFPDNPLVALVDFNNNVIEESLAVLAEFGENLAGVRVDTSSNIADQMFEDPKKDDFGINAKLIKKLREELDKNNGQHVKIIASSGLNPMKIRELEEQNAPVDFYGVGEYMLQIRNHFSADATVLNGKRLAKFGRFYRKNPKLITFEYEK
ncbi:nicotinate phosphoribosyltransferase [Mesomycoplasma ovipneumoniae]|uniref:nicotinate phosphoribosyltransferase n=1 Tax=Mesomycoplasma ovipneumoniae TaxID=29562 RepID=A0AAP6CTF1_9BACT|nr:nicotinate phosphoribosyltransferase [Mesomycoplasma ovipneumoniae]MDW2835009.1 nicotinate phosphoribosyltransferase [Mesomycoplasma ovipneumoniae]MDW2852750.1 nicotinate phosphoribosyltransferase [Mesomycoplasma ovipneumoniae]MDW2860990.1 nicotinate phosphoribosyltransferase [Mesomycoplasma ovipneumoniae]MDW2861889.1 nicotinate phosphoribosyltransferase [Mesomycoplasma ovipneumoniae]MDW2891405.1 nicotinate phosphoribosyltransferase [Mesomycoplasma ovipneumoniae]